MTDNNENILDDLEVEAADEVTGGQGPGLEVRVLGEDVGVGAGDNRHGGSTVTVGSAEIETRETRNGTQVRVSLGDDEVADVTLRDN